MMLKDYLTQLTTSEPVLLNISNLPRGIDNYHIDVKLSVRFCNDFKKLLNDYVSLETSIRQTRSRNIATEDEFRASYIDMMTVLINRVKTDLRPEDINFLQFAVYRYILENSKNSLDHHIREMRSKLNDLRSSNSAKALSMQDHVFWLRKHYNSILYAINRHFQNILAQSEKKELQALRRQYLEPGDQVYIDILLNPMLLTSDLDAANFLIEKYLLWNNNSERSEFPDLNSHLETLFEQELPEAPFKPLVEKKETTEVVEIYDDLGGLQACKHLLGPSSDTKNFISENFTWLDSPENFNHLFNIDKLNEIVWKERREHGFKAGMRINTEVKRLKKILNRINRILNDKGLLQQLSASIDTRRIWSRQLAQIMDPLVLCRYLGGDLTYSEFQKRLNRDYQFSTAEINSMQERAKAIKKKIGNTTEFLIKFLSMISNYRLHLKYYRFAHRAFNRLSILEDEEKIRLSSQAGTLYHLHAADEGEEEEVRIAHHAILKADVRGSTTVTDVLEKKELNPASYFSLRFFGPINKVLDTYGANKVFIEGDAVILSFLEYEHNPQQWHGVAHACGMAKAMLSVVQANNKYSREMDLPPIELGLGICYANYAPRYLYDGENQIMISSAIGDADRMSSCAWKLREVIKHHPYNVEVLDIAEDDKSRGEKGQQQIRYNVNGILLDNKGFDKLRNEIELTRIIGQVAGEEAVFYYGEYPDMAAKKRNLVIREGQVGLWKNDEILVNDRDEKFYEVVTNAHITAGIQGKMHKR